MRRYSALRLALFLAWLPAVSSGQQRGWTLGIRNGDDLADVELVSVQSDSLTIYYAGTIQQLTLNAIARMSRSEGGSHVVRGAAVGLLFGGGIGLVAGELIDTKNRSSKGSIVEIVPDSVVRLRTPDGNVQVMNMSDVGRITKEVGGQVASQTQPSVPADSGMPAAIERAPAVHRKSIFGVDAGLALPSGDFGSTDQVRGGLVQTGYFVGVHLMSVQDQVPVAWYTSIMLSRNRIEAPGFPSLGPDVAVDAGSYTCLWFMTGVHVVGELSPTSGIYGVGQVGEVFGWSPAINASSALGYARLKPANGSAFAFGVGGGLVINDRYTIGCKFIHGEPEYSMSIVGSALTVFVKGKQSTSILQISAGMNF